MKELLQYNLKSVRAHLVRELFQRFWDYANPAWGIEIDLFHVLGRLPEPTFTH